MDKLIASLLAAGILSSSAVALAKPAGPVSGREAKAHIVERLQLSSRVADKTKPFTVKLAGKKGDRVRAFTASNIRFTIIPGGGPPGALGGARIHIGNRVTGTLDMKTGAVRTKSVIMPR